MRTLILTILLLSGYGLNAQERSSKLTVNVLKWDKISPYFNPPLEFKDIYGDYRSPLKFYDGREVVTANDWKIRRDEIRARWNKLMGEWPELLEGQQLIYIDSIQKEGFTQYKVGFNWLPNERTEGYLLVPDGAETKPAVITVFYEPETAIGEGKEE